MNNTKQKGTITEISCQLVLTKLGYMVSTPVSENCKYDLIVDVNGLLLRIQIKTCRTTATGIVFSTKTSYTTRTQSIISSYTKEDIDFFATFYNDKMYLIPVEMCGVAEKKIQSDNLHQFEAQNIIAEMLNGNYFWENQTRIYQFDLSGREVNSFSSCIEASKAIGKPANHICQCVNGKRKTAYGYIWNKDGTIRRAR